MWFYQIRSILITKILSYINKIYWEKFYVNYLSSWNNLQTLVGTRHWVLRTQVFLMILKQRQCDETKPPLAFKGSLVGPQSVYTHVPLGIPVMWVALYRKVWPSSRKDYRCPLSWYKWMQFNSVFQLFQKKVRGHRTHSGTSSAWLHQHM